MTRVPNPPRGEVISRVAHDLRATLNALAGWGGALEAGPLSADDVRRAGAAVSRQAHMTSKRLDLALDFWRLDVGLLEMTPAPVAAGQMAQAAVALCTQVAAQRGVSCEVTSDETLMVNVHASRFSQALALILEEVIGLAPVNGRVTMGVARQGDDVGFAVAPLNGATPRALSSPFTRSLAVALVELQGGRVDAGDAGTFAIVLPCAPASVSTDAV